MTKLPIYIISRACNIVTEIKIFKNFYIFFKKSIDKRKSLLYNRKADFELAH